MQPIGTVVAKQHGKASVHLVRQSACQNCKACTLGSADSNTITIIAEDPYNVEIGQQVSIYFPPAQSVKAALLVYTIPLLSLFAGYLLLDMLPLPGGALVPALGSLLLSFASFFLLRLREKQRQDDPAFLPRIDAIVG